MESYDEVPYRSIALPQTHPDRLAVHARLFGLDPAPLAACRVLGVGCGDGANLLPVAAAFPESTVVGIDLAESAIRRGRERAAAWGVANLDLRAADLRDLPDDLGTFDYVVAHGVYGWVPDAVRDGLLALIAERLAPNGVAFVSYNALPGGHLRRLSRQMMDYHTDGLDDPKERIAQSRALLDFLLAGQPADSAYGAVLEQERAMSARYTDEHFFHDHLAAHNRAFHFHEFVDHAAQHGLAYLAEADFAAMQDRAFPAETRAALAGLDRHRREQYLDFIRGRMLRQTLVCHADAAPLEAPDPDRVRALAAAAPIRQTERDEATGVQTFESEKDKAIRTDHPFAVAVCEALGAAWPEAIPFDALWSAVSDAAGESITEAMLAQMLLDFYGDGFVRLHAHTPALARHASERPTALPVARRQAEAEGEGPVLVTNAWHRTVPLQTAEARVLTLLDGTRTRADLAAALAGGLEHPLDDMLDGLARRALLID